MSLKFEEDNNGFIFFPVYSRQLIQNSNRTLVYLVSFESNKTLVSNLRLNSPGDFISDDISPLNNWESNVKFNDLGYFPNINKDCVDKLLSIPMVSCICIGWCENGFEFSDGVPWRASFNDLTEEGKRIYYGM